MDVNTININYQMLPRYCMYVSENYDVVSININCYSLQVLDLKALFIENFPFE